MGIKKTFYGLRNSGSWVLFWRFISVSIPAVFLAGVVLLFFYAATVRTEWAMLEADETRQVEAQVEAVDHLFESIISDLMALSAHHAFHMPYEIGGDGAHKAVSREFLAFSEAKGLYDQVRLLDNRGMESVRINFNDGNPLVVPVEELQFKGDRLYFKASVDLPQGEYYASSFDLNVEKGQVERPFRPVIRFATPVFDVAGNRGGVVVVNYNGSKLIDIISSYVSDSNSEHMFLNSDGYWFVAPDSTDEWGFMFEEKRQRSFATAFPGVWAKMLEQGAGQIYVAQGLFTFRTINPLLNSIHVDKAWYDEGGYSWVILSRVTPEALNVVTQKSKGAFFVIYGTVVVIVLLGSWGYVHASISRDLAEHALRESQTRHKEAQSLAHLGHWTFDITDRKLTWSNEVYRIFGLEPGELDVTYDDFLEMVHPDDREYVDRAYTDLFESGVQYDMVHRLLMSDGTLKYVNQKCQMAYGDDGERRYSRGTIQDITERRRIEQEVYVLNQELERRVMERTKELSAVNKELESFAYSVSHDLRGPLRGIDGFSQALMEEYSDRLGDEGKGYIKRIRNATTYMAELIDDLLLLSRVTRGEMRRERVEVSELAEEVIAELRKETPERRVSVVIAEGLVCEAFDPHLMKVVLENLIGNAWKFTGTRERAEVEFGSTVIEGETVYYVRDNGVGFDMAYVDKLFEVFHRLHSPSEFSGTGVGLTTVQRVINRHGGKVWVEAEVEKGATFYFTTGSNPASKLKGQDRTVV